MAKRKSFLLRIDPKLWEELERWAADDLRSANAQIEFLLRRAVTKHRRKKLEAPPDDSSDSDQTTNQH